MKNKFLKVMPVILIVSTIISMTNLKVFALDPTGVLIDTEMQGGEELKTFGNSVLGVIMAVGIILAVIILISIGIKYITGSVEEKAGYKKAFLPYAVGCIILVAAPTIATALYEFAEEIKVEAPATIVRGAYYPGCGKIVGVEECTCGVKEYEFVSGYYCTGCNRVIYNNAGKYYCSSCDASLE